MWIVLEDDTYAQPPYIIAKLCEDGIYRVQGKTMSKENAESFALAQNEKNGNRRNTRVDL